MAVKYIKKSKSRKHKKCVSYKRRTRRNRYRKHMRGGWGGYTEQPVKMKDTNNMLMMGGWGMVLNNI